MKSNYLSRMEESEERADKTIQRVQIIFAIFLQLMMMSQLYYQFQEAKLRDSLSPQDVKIVTGIVQQQSYRQGIFQPTYKLSYSYNGKENTSNVPSEVYAKYTVGSEISLQYTFKENEKGISYEELTYIGELENNH